MATNTGGGTTASLNNTPQAQTDIYTDQTEDFVGIKIFDVMSNDLAGSAKILWSVDDGSASTDLIAQDTARAEATSGDKSANGAKIWITSDGKVGYDAGTLCAAFRQQLQSLNAGQTLSDTFTYAIRMSNGTLSWTTVTVVYSGANDRPDLAAITSGALTDTAADDMFSAITGTLSSSDVDSGDTRTYSINGGSADNSLSGYDLSKASAYGTLYLNSSTGAYTFVPNDGAIEGLKSNTSVGFTLTVTDSHSATDSETLTINITGANDTPESTASLTSATYNDTAGDDTFNSVSGSLSGTDRDGDTLSYSVAGQVADGSHAGFDKSVTNAFGTLYLNTSSGAYEFVPNDAAMEGLKASTTTSFSFTASDGTTTSAPQTLTINLNGVNDTPEIGTITDGAYNDTSANDSFSDITGTFTWADRDSGDTHAFSVPGQTSSSESGFDKQVSSTYGTLYFNSTSGVYKFVANDAAIEGLKTTDHVDFVVTVTDGSGATANDTLTINLTGVNDTPQLAAITAATYNDTPGDDTFADVTGMLGGSDRDGDTLTYAAAGQVNDGTQLGYDKSVSNTYGTLYLNSTSGAYKFVPNDGAIEALKAGTSTSFTFTASDGSATSNSQTLTINLNGVNDTPVLAAITAGTYNDTAGDDTFVNVTGTLAGSDRDNDALTYSATGQVNDNSQTGFDKSVANTYGTLYLNSTSGAYKFVPNDGAIEALKAGTSTSFTFTASDGAATSNSQTLTINLNGVNDTPEIGTIADASYTDTSANDTFPDITGSFTSTDRDPDTRTFSVPGQTASAEVGFDQQVVSTYGTLYFNSTSGAYKFVANDAAIEGLKTTDHVDFVVTVTDGSSATASDTLTITLNGVNDAPELSATLTSHTYVDTAADDTFTAVNGTLTSTDRDVPDTATYSIDGGATDLSLSGYNVSKSSTYGKLYLNTSTGAYTFVPNDGAIEALKTNASATFTLTVTDGSSATDSETLTINLTGANDTPELAAITAATYNDTAGDDTFLAHSGTLSGSDRDDATLTYAVAGQADDASQSGFDKSVTSSFGTLYLNSTSGAYKFVPNDTAIEGLKSATTTSFSFTASDGTATSAPQTLTINLNGVNDTPELGTVTGASYTDTSANDTFADTTGTLTATDRDTVDSKTFAIDGSSASSEFGFDRELTTTYGTLYLNSTSGAYKFVPNDAAIEGLKTTDHVDFTVRVTDALGASDTDTLTITLNGANDAPDLTASVTSATLTDTAADDTFAAVNGTLSAVDRDLGDTATYGITGGSADISLAGYNVSKSSPYGTLYLDSFSGAYTFVPNDGAIEGLKADTSVGFTLTVTDGSSASDSETLTISITGMNDNPELTASLTSATYTDTSADDTFTAVNGTLSSSDRDTGDSATYGITGGSADNSLAGYNVSKTSAYGTLYLNSTSGAYRFVPNDLAIEQLKSGTSVGFTLTVTDASGGTDSKALTINLTGANDTPDLAAITAATYNDTAADDTFADHTGTLSGSDRDGDTLTYAAAGQVNDATQLGYDKSVSNAYGTLYLDSASGAYKFVPNDAAIEALKAGTTTSFTFTASDGSATSAPQTLTINLNGVNDTPQLAAITAATYNDTPGDDTFADVTGMLGGSDRDGDTLTYAAAGQVNDGTQVGYDKSVSNTYGTLYLNSTSGAYKFVPNDGAIEALKAGTTTSFTFTASDGSATSNSQTLTINLNGVNDTPVLAAITAGTYNDTAGDDTFVNVTGTLAGSDRDNDALTYSATGQVNDNSQTGFDKSVANAYGTLYLNSTSGAYKFVPNDGAIEALKAGTSTSFTFTASDGSATSNSQTLTINLNGVNDTPEIAAITAATYNDTAADDTFANVTGTLSGSDRDNDTLTYSAAGQVSDLSQTGFDKSVTNAYGTLYLNSTSGAYKFVPNDAAIEGLQAATSTSFSFTANDGTANSAAQTLTINLNAVNDEPVVDLNGSATGGTGATLNYTAGSAAAVIAPAGIVTDRDSANFDTGSLNVAISGATAADTLTIFNQGTGAGQIGISGSNVTYGGVVIGTFSGGSGGTALQINFNASATQAAVSALVEDIRYSNATSGAATKTVTYSLVDGDGVANGGDDTGTATATINVTAGNQAPTTAGDVIWMSNSTTGAFATDLLLANDTDPDGLSLTITNLVVSGSTLGGSASVALNSNGTFTLATGATGGTVGTPATVTLTYTVNDNAGGTSTGTVTVKIVTTGDSGGADVIDLTGQAYDASYIDGKAQGDQLTDGASVSTLIGGDGNDTLVGAAGNDILRPGAGNNDSVDGGAGTEDMLDFSDGTTAIGTSGTPFVFAQSTSAFITLANGFAGLGNQDQYRNVEGLIGTSQADFITGTAANDIFRGGGGNDRLDGAGGLDLLDLSDATGSISINFSQGVNQTITAGGVGTDTYSNFEGVIGSGFDDTLNGSASADILRGGAGNDTINGNDGDDTLRGDAGNDIINGGNGNDTITGGTGADQLTGGAGNDIFVFTSPLNNVDTITDFDANGADKISLNSTAFSALGAAFDASEFVANAGGTAQDADDYILYDTTTGNLYYDADGNGVGARVLIATLTSPTGTVDHGDFLFGP